MHGSFSRGDTMNFMAAIGPDFKAGYVDAAAGQQCRCRRDGRAAPGPAQKPQNGGLVGRVMTEAMPNGASPKAYAGTVKSKPRRTACGPC